MSCHAHAPNELCAWMGEVRTSKVPYALEIEVHACPPMNCVPDIEVCALRELSCAPKTEVRTLEIEVRARPQ